jgi:hypothetical protein
MISTTKCSSCLAPIKYLRTEAGHWMPVNPESIEGAETVFRPGIHISHFATCPHADEHRKSK